MISISDKITSFFHKIHKFNEWKKNSAITEVLFIELPYFTQQIEKAYTKPPLIIFDIDDTLLDTEKFSKNFPLFDGIDPAVTLYNYLLDLGYHIVILTARKEDRRETTIYNLNRIKVKNYDELIMRKETDLGVSFAKYKLQERIKLSRNYTIVANIGDQMSDFEGGYNGKIIKIPTF